MGRLRCVTIKNVQVPIGTPITFEGKEVGHIVKNNNDSSECMINSDIVNQLIKSNNISFSLEVIKK